MTFSRFAVITVCALFSIGQVCAGSNHHVARQGTLDPGQFPPQCQNSCATIINDISACAASLACICTTANANTLLTCVDCVVSNNYTVAHDEEGQSELDAFTTNCNAAGFKVPSMVVSVSVAGATATNGGSGFTQGATITAGGSAATQKPNPFKSGSASNIAGERMRGLVVMSAIAVGFLLAVS